LFLAAPAVDLVGVLAPDRAGNRYEIYLALGIAADAARHPDIFDIQAQGAERETRLYGDFVLARRQCKRGSRTRRCWCSPASTPIQTGKG
jgi:hypothetical protein